LTAGTLFADTSRMIMKKDGLAFAAAILLTGNATWCAAGMTTGFRCLAGLAVVSLWLGLLPRGWSSAKRRRQYLVALALGFFVLAPAQFGAWFMLGALMAMMAGMFGLGSANTAATAILLLGVMILPMQILLFPAAAALMHRLPFFSTTSILNLATVLALASSLSLYLVATARILFGFALIL